MQLDKQLKVAFLAGILAILFAHFQLVPQHYLLNMSSNFGGPDANQNPLL